MVNRPVAFDNPMKRTSTAVDRARKFDLSPRNAIPSPNDRGVAHVWQVIDNRGKGVIVATGDLRLEFFSVSSSIERILV